MRAAHRAALLVLVAAFAVAFAIPVAAPPSSIDAQTATDNTPTPDVVIEAYTEAGGGPDDIYDTQLEGARGALSTAQNFAGLVAQLENGGVFASQFKDTASLASDGLNTLRPSDEYPLGGIGYPASIEDTRAILRAVGVTMIEIPGTGYFTAPNGRQLYTARRTLQRLGNAWTAWPNVTSFQQGNPEILDFATAATLIQANIQRLERLRAADQQVWEGADDGDDSNDIAAFSAPSASPTGRAGDSVYIQITDLGPGDGDADPPEPGSVSTLFRFSVNAGATFKSSGRTALTCTDNDNRRGCDLDADRDEMTVELVIADDAPTNTNIIVNVQNVNDDKTVRVVIPVIGGPGRAGNGAGPAPQPVPPAGSNVPPASFYGGGLTRGDVVTASIGGTACGEAETGAGGSWSLVVDAGGCGGKAVEGATIAFAVNGRVAEQRAVWRSGGVPGDPGVPGDTSGGIALTVAANANGLPASFYGGGLTRGDMVTASIGGTACGEAVAGAGGGWSILVEEGGCGGKAVDGATIAFAVNGRAARPTATWRAGGLPDDREGGIALTAAGMTIRLRGVRAVYVQDMDGGFDIHVPGAPDFVNARFGRRWIAAATPLTLTLGTEGVRAVYVQSADRTFDSHVAGAPDFVNAAFARRWIVDATE